jgi:GntR family transcriptional regulator, rspAB operon transcriptional repressor
VLLRSELQQRFDASSTPISDALLSLQQERLVIIHPQHKTFVSRIDLDDARQASFARQAIELEVVETLATQRTHENVERLRSALDLQAAVASVRRFDEFSRLDETFHAMLYEMAGVAALWDFVAKRSGHLNRVRRLSLPVENKMDRILSEHRAIVEAVIAADVAAARGRVRLHLSQSLQMIGKIVDETPDFFTVE